MVAVLVTAMSHDADALIPWAIGVAMILACPAALWIAPNLMLEQESRPPRQHGRFLVLIRDDGFHIGC